MVFMRNRNKPAEPDSIELAQLDTLLQTSKSNQQATWDA